MSLFWNEGETEREYNIRMMYEDGKISEDKYDELMYEEEEHKEYIKLQMQEYEVNEYRFRDYKFIKYCISLIRPNRKYYKKKSTIKKIMDIIESFKEQDDRYYYTNEQLIKCYKDKFSPRRQKFITRIITIVMTGIFEEMHIIENKKFIIKRDIIEEYYDY